MRVLSTQSAFHRPRTMKAFRHRARQRSRRWRRRLRQLSMALHMREIAVERPVRLYHKDAEHIVFEDRVSLRCENVESWRRRGIENFFPRQANFSYENF